MFDGFEGKAFKSATRGGTDLSKIGADTEDAEKEKDAAKEDADKVAETELCPLSPV